MQPTATYSPEDNKIRIYPVVRFGAETLARLKSAGFKWAPKQGLFVAPMWTPEREDLAEELAGEIGDEDTTLVDRAEERAERFDGYSDRRAEDAERAKSAVEAIADGIPFGQPILIGHHSQRRAEKDAERIKAGMAKAVKLWRTSRYWQQRAAGALSHAKYKELPSVRARRIKTLQADKRKRERQRADAEKCLRFWSRDGITQEQAIAYCNCDDRYGLVLPDGSRDWSAWAALDRGTVTVEYVAAIRRERMPDIIAYENRWIEHYENRIAYETAMLGEQGGTVADRKPVEKGGAVRVWCSPGFGGRGWSFVVKVNKVSVTVYDNWGNGGPNFTRTVPFTDIRGSMTSAEVDAARAAGRMDVTADGKGFYLRDDKPAEVPPAPTPKAEPTDFDRMAETLRAGVQAVSAPNLFPTPPDVAKRVVQLAEIEPGMSVLEPSAGTGNLAVAVRDEVDTEVLAYEINPALCQVIRSRLPNFACVARCADFLAVTEGMGQFERVVMNPPFDHGSDIDHVRHALRFLKPGGRLVAIVADGPKQRAELQPMADCWEELPAGTFAGTGVRSAIVVITS